MLADAYVSGRVITEKSSVITSTALAVVLEGVGNLFRIGTAESRLQSTNAALYTDRRTLRCEQQRRR